MSRSSSRKASCNVPASAMASSIQSIAINREDQRVLVNRSTRYATRTLQPRVGCSGWNYKCWRGVFYPPDLPSTQWLRFYAGRFDTVEVNNTFYRLRERSTFARWRKQLPRGFLVAVKASRFLTHMKRLRDPDEPLARLFSRASALGRGLGPTLYQLPG